MFKLLASILLSKPEVRVSIKEVKSNEQVEVVILPSPLRMTRWANENLIMIKRGSSIWRADIKDLSPIELENLLVARLHVLQPKSISVEYGEEAVESERSREEKFLSGVLERI